MLSILWLAKLILFQFYIGEIIDLLVYIYISIYKYINIPKYIYDLNYFISMYTFIYKYMEFYIYCSYIILLLQSYYQKIIISKILLRIKLN